MDKPPTPSAPPANRSILIIGIISGIGGLGLAAWIFFAGDLQPNTGNTNRLPNDNTSGTNQNLNVIENTNVLTNTLENTNTAPTPQVSWEEPRELENLRLLGKSDYYDYDEAASPKYYSLGTVNTGIYSGGTLILVTYQEEGPSFYPTYYRIVKTTENKYVLLTTYSTGDWSAEYSAETIQRLARQGITLDKTTSFDSLSKWQPTITLSDPAVTLKQDQNVNALWNVSELRKIFTDPVYGDGFTTASVATPDPSSLGATSINSRNGIYFRAADGTMRAYYLFPDFMQPKEYDRYAGDASITWANGSSTIHEYQFSAFYGCGAANYAHVIADDTYNIATDMEEIGTTSTGDPIYQEKNRDSRRLHEYYDTTYTVFEGTKVDFSDFAQDRPLIYWVDPFDRLIELSNADYKLAAECGKPVIYLYPEQPTRVSVKLRPSGGFRVSEPDYGGGWNVLARPDGRLTDLRTGRDYPYLYWEGSGGIYQTPPQGFVVSQSDLHGFLIDSLSRLGLNQKETADFIEFWEPKMQGSPYYFVTFMGNRVMDELAPLTVKPRPDTVIRILMDYLPLDQPIKVPAYALHAPERRGFTVIEWGGVIRK